MEKTGLYKKNKAYIISVLILVVFCIVFLIVDYYLYRKYLVDKQFLYLFYMIVPTLFFIYCFSVLFIHVIGKLIGYKKVIVNKIKVDNPYIYYRELPNTYGIGVASLLFNSKIENEKDIVAIILNLCAKKYLTITKIKDKYIIRVLKNIDNGLLSNEKYIMMCIENNLIQNLNYDEWFNYVMQDGIDLGLFTQNEIKKDYSGRALKDVYEGGVNSVMYHNLTLTNKGKEEIVKLKAFKRFLEDFGSFEIKNPEEVILWDYYLCYAQVFGIAKNILKTGYKKLVQNSSFQIDDLDSIYLKDTIIEKRRCKSLSEKIV